MPGIRRFAAALAAACLGIVMVAGVSAAPAEATYASQCGAPTRVLDPSAPSVSVAAGETVLLASGTFVGGIDALPSGATLCVAAGATTRPAYLNNGSGAVVIQADGTAAFPSISVGTGFALGVEGSASFAGLNVNGASTFDIAAGGSLTVAGGFSPSAGSFSNAGTLVLAGLNLNSGASIDNSGRLTVNGDANVNGRLDNTGQVDVGGVLTVNGGAAFANECRVNTTGALTNNAAGSTNAGIVVAGGSFTNNGTWRQSVEGLLASTGLTDDGTVSGFGAYQFAGFTSAQGRFTGDSAGSPIQVQTQAPPGNIFDVQTGTIVNVIRVTAARSTGPDAPLSGCSNNVLSFADLAVSKSGPATAVQNADVTYTVSATNAGPDDATGVVVRDALPPEVTAVADAGGGAVASGVITWTVGPLAAGATASFTFTVSQAAAVGTVLHDVASATAGTPDPDPSNNNGTSADSQADTTIVGAPPPANNPPVADPLTQPGFTGQLLFGRVTATDPDAGQKLTYAIVTPPAHGRAVMVAGGLFAYRSAAAFTGDDSFVYRVCDDGSPALCDTATVSLPISPVAVDDTAVTAADTAVTIPVLANDSLGAALTAVDSGPSNGTAVVDAATGTVVYTPAAGFIGQDAFAYRICSPTNPALCSTATVMVTVRPANHPPVIQPLHLVTTVGVPVSGTVQASDPDAGQTLTYERGIPPRTGTSRVTGDRTTYAPRSTFAGTDAYSVIACDDGDPVLCATGMVTVDVYPVADPDSASTTDGTPVSVPVTGNDLGAVLPPTIATGAGHGSVRVDGSSIVYTPAPGFTGQDTFEYTICAAAAPTLCSTATVTVTVTAGGVVPPTPPSGGSGTGSAEAGVGGSLPDTGSSLPEAGMIGAAIAAAAAIGLGTVLLLRRRRSV